MVDSHPIASQPAETKRGWKSSKAFGLAALIVGVVLLAAGIAYYVYGWIAVSDLDDFNVALPEPPLLSGLDSTGIGSDTPSGGPDVSGIDLVTTNPRYWVDARNAQPGLDAGDWDAKGYMPPTPNVFTGPAPAATRIRVPAINVDSALQELKIVDLGDSRAWESPENVVGHIPTTATPGLQGQGWYFGHLESPIAGNGNVFSRLPQIPGLLRDGENVFVFLEGPDRKYLYQVYKTEVVAADELRLTDSGAAEVTLVACYPRLTYSHRLLVTARLIGVQEYA